MAYSLGLLKIAHRDDFRIEDEIRAHPRVLRRWGLVHVWIVGSGVEVGIGSALEGGLEGGVDN